MKMTDEHYAILSEAILSLDAVKIRGIAKINKEYTDQDLSDRSFRQDLLWLADSAFRVTDSEGRGILSRWDYMDAHIDTALRKIIKENS